MSLQAMEAVLVELDTKGSVSSEKSIALELVEKGDILKVWSGRFQFTSVTSSYILVTVIEISN